MTQIERARGVSEIPQTHAIESSKSIFREDPRYLLPSQEIFLSPSIKKPGLAHPDSFKQSSKPMALIVANFLTRIEHFRETYVQMLEREIDQINEVFSVSLEKHSEAQSKLDKATQSSDYWDFLSKIGACLVGAASIVLGATLLVPGASTMAVIAGSSMILSGTSGILGSIISDMKTHPQLATSLAVVSAGFAVAGGISGALTGVNALTNNLGRIIAASLGVVSGSTAIIKNTYQMDLADIQASDALIRKANEINSSRLIEMKEELEHFEQCSARSTDKLIIGVTELQASSRKVTALSGPLGAA